MSVAYVKAAFAASDGRTRMERIEQNAPLKIARTFDLNGGALGVCIMDASPGMLAGDRYQFDFAVAADARVAVTTQGFTRVHPSRDNPCELQTRLQVGDGATLQWFPEPLMLYAGADLRAQTTVELAPTATFLGADIWCAGRIGRGESWEFARHRSRWNINRAGAPLYASSVDIEPANFDAKQIGAWNGWTHSGNFWALYAANAELDERLCEAFWQIIEEQTVYAGASVLAAGGVVWFRCWARARTIWRN